MIVRYAIGVALGLVVTFLLFLVMQAVISNDEANIDEGVKGKLLDMVRLTMMRKFKPSNVSQNRHPRRMNRRQICPSLNLSLLTYQPGSMWALLMSMLI